MESSSVEFFKDYIGRAQALLAGQDLSGVSRLAAEVRKAWGTGKRVYLCGNGGSAANAMHIANDLLYGVGKGKVPGVRVTALTADIGIVTCLANDVGYESIFSKQLEVQASAGDVLIALSGSGNSPNILKALQIAKELKMKTFAILGYSGGKALALADTAVHFPIHDMQIAEDMQLMVGHMIMQWLAQDPVYPVGE